MVSFNCDNCGDVVKKPKLDQHRKHCNASFTCLDCSTQFSGPSEYKGHTTCVSEAEKYERSTYREPKKDVHKKSNGAPITNSNQKGTLKAHDAKKTSHDPTKSNSPQQEPKQVDHETNSATKQPFSSAIEKNSAGVNENIKGNKNGNTPSKKRKHEEHDKNGNGSSYINDTGSQVENRNDAEVAKAAKRLKKEKKNREKAKKSHEYTRNSTEMKLLTNAKKIREIVENNLECKEKDVCPSLLEVANLLGLGALESSTLTEWTTLLESIKVKAHSKKRNNISLHWEDKS